MVRHSADCEGLEFICSRDTRHIRPQSLFQVRRNDGPAVFGGEDAMVKAAAICVGHRAGIVVQPSFNKTKRLPYLIRFSAVPLKGDSG